MPGQNLHLDWNMHKSQVFRSVGLAAALWLGIGLPSAWAEIRLPNVFSSHMVLQRDMPLIDLGLGAAKRDGHGVVWQRHGAVQANDTGEWKATLPAMKAGGPFTLKVTGSNTVEFDDVMIGEVWLCSGQSNMEMGIGMARDAQKEIAEANHPGIRLLLVTRKWSPLPQTNIDGAWKVCSPANGWPRVVGTGFRRQLIISGGS